MPQNYRPERSGRWRDDRAERSERNRNFQDDRFSPHQDADFNQDRDSDYSYFAESSDSDRRDARDRTSNQRWPESAGGNREPAWRRTESFGNQYNSDARSQRFDRDRQFEQRYESGPRRGSEGGGRLMQWDDDRDDGRYFGTGSYHGAYSTGPGARASGSFSDEHSYLGYRNPMWRDEPQTWREDDARSSGSTGDSNVYARSAYGAQGGFDRPYAGARESSSGRGGRGFGQDYREQFAEQRYGRQPTFGYGFTEGASETFRGRGPKGYERSDERLREIICERLTDDPRIDASDVHIEVKDKVAKLTGQVPDRRTKYEIEDVVEHCGVKDIDNQVRVRSRNESAPSSGTALGYQTASESSSGSTSNPSTRSKRN